MDTAVGIVIFLDIKVIFQLDPIHDVRFSDLHSTVRYPARVAERLSRHPRDHRASGAVEPEQRRLAAGFYPFRIKIWVAVPMTAKDARGQGGI